MSVTTIQVTPATRQKLARLKSSSGETYDDLINKLLSLVPEGDEEGPYTHAFRLGLLQARLDVKEGRVLTHEEVKLRLGRSEEHTSELQSPCNLVCRLLLEKKKT